MSTIARLRGLRPSRPLRGRRPAEETETARERKRRREEEEEGLPDPSQPSPSQKQQMIYLFFPPPLITAQHLYCGSSLHLPVWGTFAAAQIDAGFQGVNPASVMAALIPPSFPGRAGQGRAVQHHGRGQQRSSQRRNRADFFWHLPLPPYPNSHIIAGKKPNQTTATTKDKQKTIMYHFSKKKDL